MVERTFDVIVVGCGIAGLSAAVMAQQNGASVAILERAPKEERGGNTRYTESLWRMKTVDTVSDDFHEKFSENFGGWPDPAIVRDTVLDFDRQPRVLRSLGILDPNLVSAIADEAPKAIDWLGNFGVKFDYLPMYFLSQTTTRMGPIGGGLALIEALGGYADQKANEIKFFYETSARSLIVNETGEIIGVNVIGDANMPFSLMAKNVVLACGGFQGNPEMLSHYIGPQAQYIRPISRGGHYNRGEGVRMALEIGAAPCGDFGSFHAQPVDPRSPDIEPVVLNYNFGVLINDSGHRFTDEGPAMVDATYEVVTRLIMGERNGIAYAVFDASIDDIENWQMTVRSRVPPFEEGSLWELANSIKVDAQEMMATIDTYNKACPSSEEFDPLTLDRLATSGITPRKSNWARPIVKPPFRAWPIICSNCFTFGGVKIDERARVINTEGDVIPGLYAAGEVAGLYYRVYTGATSVMRGAVTGRWAGADASLRRNTSPRTPFPRPPHIEEDFQY